MKILHLTVHLGGGAGKAITGMLNPDDTVILLEKPEKDYYVRIASQKVAEVLIAPSEEIIAQRMRQADVVLINWWGHPLMAGFLAKLPQVACHLAIWNHVNGCVYPCLPFKFLDDFDQILFTTEFSYDNPLWIENEKKKIAQKASVVYGMGDFRPKCMKPKNSYSFQGKFTVGYLGTCNYAKLNPKFIDYCEAVVEEIPDVHFCLVGGLSDEVRSDIERSPIADRFECVDFVENVEDYYKYFDAFGYLLNGYNYATTENVLLEAMAYGLPIVVLDNDVEKHIIYHSVNGYVVDTPKEYALCLKKLYQDPCLRESIGRKAREFVCKTYDTVENKRKFAESMKKCQQRRKKVHDFKSILGVSPYEYFKRFLSPEEQTQLEEMLCTGKREGIMKQDVFTQESKGSVEHYCKYFPKDEKLEQLRGCLLKS